MFEEKRAYQRKETSLCTNIMDIQNHTVIGECLMTDVCDCGFAIESEEELLIGQKIVLKFTLLNKTVFLAGEIIRTAKGFFYPLYGAKICEYKCINFNIFREYIKYYLN